MCVKMHPIWEHLERKYLVDFYSGRKHNGMIDEMNLGNLRIKILNSQRVSFGKGWISW